MLFYFRGHKHPSTVLQLIFDMHPLCPVHVATLLLPTLLQDEETHRVDGVFVICNFAYKSSNTFYIRRNIENIRDEYVKRMLQIMLPRPDRCKIKVPYHFVAYTPLSTTQYLSEYRINDFINKRFIKYRNITYSFLLHYYKNIRLFLFISPSC